MYSKFNRVKKLLLILSIGLISTYSFSQSKEELIGTWEFKKFVVEKSGTTKKRYKSKEEWSPKVINFNKGGTFTSTEIAYTDEKEESAKGKWTFIADKVSFTYYTNDGMPYGEEDPGQKYLIHKLTKRKMILVFREAMTENGQGKGVRTDVYVTYNRAK